MSPGHADDRRWRHAGLRPTGLLAVVALVLFSHLAMTLHRRSQHGGDFDISRELGRRFLAGEDLYAGGLHYPYLPSAGLWFGPLALTSASVAFVVRYLVSVAALAITLYLLARRVRAHVPALRGGEVGVGALTLLLGAHYVLRDLDDGGPHLQLLALVVVALDAVAAGRNRRAAACFGLATALKAPLGIFLPLLLWERRWRLAALTTVATGLWVVVPAVWMGPGGWWTQQQQWLRYASASIIGTPLPGAAESEGRIQNQALRPVLLRLLAPAPAPAEAAVVNAGLPLPGARGMTLALCVGLVVACAWRDRGPCRSERWLAACSVTAILSPLLAPLAWAQHLVLALPALYLIAAQWMVGGGLGPGSRAALAVYAVLALGLNRELLGRDAYLVLLGLGLQTACMLLILGIVLSTCPPQPRTDAR